MKIDVIGDIHGCYDELLILLEKLGYRWDGNELFHKENRKLAFVGDLTDRGPDSLKVIQFVSAVVNNNGAHYIPGNHCNKLYRYFLGNKIQITHGLETTVAEFEALNKNQQDEIRKMFIKLYEQAPLYHVLDQKQLVVAHAGIREDYIGRTDKRVQTFVLYGDISGKTNSDGTPERRDWAQNYQGKSMIVYGHTPVREPRRINRTINIDTGAVFGGKLTAYRYPEDLTVSVPSTMPLVKEKFRALDS
ncbi:bis(5'-nucleosyl)-tetraphosphatase PrpE [Bacillus timonensis]|nr:bis(5'-nucleosyl)-tetraphosphatase PrpE [Bacillus timonensis]